MISHRLFQLSGPGTFTLLALLLVCTGSQSHAADKAPSSTTLKIHIISGSKEYKSEPSLTGYKKYLESKYKVSVSASWGKDGSKHLDDLDKLKDAELMLIFARRMKLPEQQMKIIRAHWEQGKAIVGLRTAGHAFQKSENEVFDKQVLGGHYSGHFGNEPVKVINQDDQAKHPVLKGVGPFSSRKLYKAAQLAKDTIVLQMGDIGKDRHAVTIVHNYKGGRTFFSSLGVPEDFKDENFVRMLDNAVFWTTRRDPEKMKK